MTQVKSVRSLLIRIKCLPLSLRDKGVLVLGPGLGQTMGEVVGRGEGPTDSPCFGP